MKVIKIDVDKIEQNENSRAVYKEADFSELMHSMKLEGLLQPIGVKDLGQGAYEAVFGNRRLVAARKLGWSEISAVVLENVETDSDRDFLNLIENLKREQISVSEEGRLYQVMMDRGLSEKEIATRLNVPPQRVRVATEVIREVPVEFRAKIVNRQSGVKVPGTISAAAYVAISNLRKTENLNRGQFRQLLEFAATRDVTASQVGAIGPLFKNGFTLEDAIDQTSRWNRIAFDIFIQQADREKIEKKTGRSMNDLIWEVLETHKELKLIRKPRVSGVYPKAISTWKRAKQEKELRD